MQRKNLGNSGEDLAEQFLIEKNYQIIARNYRLKIGEIDLLATDGDFLVIVEVKTKTNFAQGRPEEKVDYFKQKKLRLLAHALAQKYPNKPIRIDVVAVDMSGAKPEFKHIINAVEEM